MTQLQSQMLTIDPVLTVPDIVQKSSPPLQSHRVNAGKLDQRLSMTDCESSLVLFVALISLNRSRHVTKAGTGQVSVLNTHTYAWLIEIDLKGLLFALDPSRHPPVRSAV